MYLFPLNRSHRGQLIYTVTVPALPGGVTQGETLEEAVASARDALQGYIEARAKDGPPIPGRARAPQLRTISRSTTNCGTYQNFTTSTNASGTTTIHVSGAAAGQTCIGSVRVDPRSVVGSAVPNQSKATYTNATSVNRMAIPSSVQSILLQQQ